MNQCVKAYANFDKPGWTKFQVHLIIKQSEEIVEDRLNN
jgi:hypothetical protein